MQLIGNYRHLSSATQINQDYKCYQFPFASSVALKTANFLTKSPFTKLQVLFFCTNFLTTIEILFPAVVLFTNENAQLVKFVETLRLKKYSWENKLVQKHNTPNELHTAKEFESFFLVKAFIFFSFLSFALLWIAQHMTEKGELKLNEILAINFSCCSN